MTQAVITKMKNQSINLPKAWKGERVLVRITDDTATITKIPSSKNIFTREEIKSMRSFGKKISKSILREAITKAKFKSD